MVEETYAKLRGLQDILIRRFEIENEISDIPKVLATKKELLARLKKSYIEKNETFDKTKTRIEDLRNRAIEAEREREKSEGQMDLIKTQREYEALDKEIRDAAEREAELRRELQREEENLEEMQVGLEREEALIGSQEQEVSDEQSRIENEIEERKATLEELKGEEKQITPGLDEELLFKFERIIRSTGGLGIVPLQGEICTGCYMTLPPHFVNHVRQGEEISFCACGSRIVYYEDEDQVVPPEDGDFTLDDDFDEELSFATSEDEEE